MVVAASRSIPGRACEYTPRVNPTEARPSRWLTIFGLMLALSAAVA